MRPLKRLTLIGFLFLLFASYGYAADLDFPYGTFRLKLPPAEDPFPGFGNYYTSVATGLKSALWNPASLGKLELSEASFSTRTALETYNYQRSFQLGEISDNFSLNGGSSAGSYGLFFRYPQNIGSGINTQEVDMAAHVNYATETTGQNFSAALKVNEWVTVGFSTNSPVGITGNLAGDFPVTTRAITNFYGQTINDMQIGANGKLTYTFNSGGIVTTYESTQALWSGFLSQEATIPLTALIEGNNSINIKSPYTGTIASHYGNLYLGLNMIPVAATANIDNDLRSVFSSDTQDAFLYTPDFDPNNETDLANWINDPDQYATQDGYKRKQIRLPAGEIIADTKYRGFYTASTTRLDLGAMYDLTDWLTVGIMLENLSGSRLDFKGNGLASYINYREINTAEASNLQDLIQPGGQDSLDIISDRWVTTFEAGSHKLYLEPEKTYELPKRLRYGFALKRPFLIAVDFEQNQTPIKVNYVENNALKEINISNISLIRIGTETRFFALPFWLRSGLTLMSKPTVTGLDANTQDSLNQVFQFGVLPLKFDLGSDANFWGTYVGGSFGVNGQSLFSFLQLDTTNLDLSKLVFYSLYAARDAWNVSYLASLDPTGTAAAYGTKTVPAGQEKQFEFSDVKFIQTLGITYRF